MRERDSFFGGVQPVLANKRPGKKKKEKKTDRPATSVSSAAHARSHARKSVETLPESAKSPAAPRAQELLPGTTAIESGRGATHDLELEKAKPSQPDNAAVTPAKSASDVSDELARLRAELQEQREVRAALESRLREAEVRLKQAGTLAAAASSPAPATTPVVSAKTAVTSTLDDLGIFAPPSVPGAKGAPVVIEALETWLMEAELRASDAAGVLAQPQPPTAAMILDALPESELAGKMASTRLALEAAEARAAHNARQVKKLTEELAEARAAQIRAEARIRAVENRLRQAEARAGLLDKYIEEPEPEPISLAWPMEVLDASTVAVAPEKPREEVPPEDASSLLDEVAPSEDELELLTPEPEESAERAGDALEGSLVLGPPLEEAPIHESDAASPGIAEEDDLTAALEEWASQEEGAAVPELPCTPDTSELVAESAAATVASDTEVTDDLAAALSDWGAGIEEPAAEVVSAETAAIELVQDESVVTEPREGESLDEALSAWGATEEREPAPPVEEIEVETAEKSVELPERASASSRESMLEALHMWSGKPTPAPAASESATADTTASEDVGHENPDMKKKSGKEAMVEALLRFMGPAS